MKIVVPISKALFEKMKSNKNHIEDFYYDDICPVAKAVSRGKSLTNKDAIKELENEKEKFAIEELEHLKADIRFHGFYDERVEDLIDKHIEELKGEK